ncbi:CheY chemotaxis protein or a CheY-like REC (receiver) domain [Anaerovirgula multivorans]|uniref:Stage 0 sporulation protein A homolog n=1 Tax=Anaerovirgula multivorans TaxID=312168 RepID=A0A239J139_9FIRM|nr:response regulator [Anaerovirgula multivorans]SNS99550.1 CheY chemotaxis protein or a CheY-like REC (receiver) domain [Anaerovirgula multivorans]
MIETTKEKIKTVLLVEDDKINQKIIDALLKKQGWNVISTSNGEEAIEICTKQALDMILMDLNLPKIDGLEATTRIRVLDKWQKKHTPIIGMTASDIQREKEKCFQMGMDGYITKPIETKKLYDAIEEIIGEKTYKSPCIDIEGALDNVEGDKELLKELIEDFIDEEYSIVLLKDIKIAADTKDFTVLYKKAHKLKGAAACLNINSINHIAYQLEEKGKKQESNGLNELVNDLKKEYKIIKNYFANYKWED